MLLTIYSLISLCYWVFLTLWLLINGRKIKYVSTIQKKDTKPEPSVRIIIAARNEEAALAEALTSVCNLEYSNYKITVINDRSTDDTAKILADLKTTYDKLTVINIDTLPPGWLGKNHALYAGALAAEEEYLLFTDADVLYEKGVLNRAMNYCLQHELDHLAILPGMISSSVALNSVVMTFVIMLTAVQRPWAAKNKNSKTSMGVGAFNFVKREMYVKAGTHQAIAMRPDDDLKLAAHIKKAGGQSDVLYGREALQVEWYSTVKEFINGLMKNLYSGFKYNPLLAAAGALGTLLFFVLPGPVVLIFGNNVARFIVLVMFLFQAILYEKLPGANGKWWYAFLTIYSGSVIVYVIIKSTFLTLKNKGIYWRDTFYSLKELRKA